MNKEINNNIKIIGKLMSLESKVNVVGSANVKRNLYYSDYDLLQEVQGKSEQLISARDQRKARLQRWLRSREQSARPTAARCTRRASA